MGRPMSAESQEILDIVRAHGPIDLNGICARARLLRDRVDIAGTLYRLRDAGHLLKKPDRTYLINGRNAAAPEAAPAAAAAQNGEPNWPRPATTGEPEPDHDAPEITTPAAARNIADIARKHATPRPQDEVAPSDPPFEAVLASTAERLQQSLDLLIAQTGELAPIIAEQIKLRDDIRELLTRYRNKAA